MIDFTDCEIDPFKPYNGSNGNKIAVVYEGHPYMIKFPPKKTDRMNYLNSCLSEHIGCNVLRICGFDCQETIIGRQCASPPFSTAGRASIHSFRRSPMLRF